MIAPSEIAVRLIVAAVLGAGVGFEREWKDQAAGLRTHALVGLGAALFMIVSAFGFSDVLGTPHVELDPSRIAAQVVTGIGFLASGAIIFQHDMIRGLTTAGSIWVVAAIGLAVGAGLFLGALAATGLCLVILALLRILERRLNLKHSPSSIHVVFDPVALSLSAVLGVLEAAGIETGGVSISTDGRLRRATISTSPGANLSPAIEGLMALAGVRNASTARDGGVGD